MKSINRKKIIQNILKFVKINYNLTEEILNYEIKNNNNNIEFKGKIKLNNSDYLYLKSLIEKDLNKDEKKKDSSLDYHNLNKFDKNEQILNFIKETFVLEEITKNPIVLEVLVNSGKNGSLQLYGNKLTPVFQKHFYTFLNENEEYILSKEELFEIKTAFLNFANKVGLAKYPLNLNEKLYNEILSENPEFYPKTIEENQKHSSFLFEKYNKSISKKEKEMFKNLILKSDLLMKRKDNPLIIEEFEKKNKKFHIVDICCYYEYSIEWEGTFESEKNFRFISNQELSEKQITDILYNIYLPEDGQFIGFEILNRDFNFGNNNDTFIEISGESLITRPGNERYVYFKENKNNRENFNEDLKF